MAAALALPPATAAVAATPEPSAPELNAVAAGTGSISGKVTLSDGSPLSDGSVRAESAVGLGDGHASTANDGTYRIDGLAPGRYTLRFEPGWRREDLADYVVEYWNNKNVTQEPTYFDLAAGQIRTGMNATLGRGATVSGRVTLAGGVPTGTCSISVASAAGFSAKADNSGEVSQDGTFSIRAIPSGTWTLEFWCDDTYGRRYMPEYWGDRPYRSQATYFTVGAGDVRTDMNAELIRGGSISGRLTAPDGKPLADVSVMLDSAHSWVTGVDRQERILGAQTDANGDYTVQGVAPGLWTLYVYSPEGSGLRHEWWSDRPWGNGDPIRVLPQQDLLGKNLQLTYASKTHPWGTVSRIAGIDRYATAARVSASQFAPGVPVAFVASGATFPDALSAAPVAATSGGPILLSSKDVLPVVVADELRRLRPKRIVVLGGTGAVSSAVASKLAAFTAGTVTRVGGDDRYATSAALSKSRFAPGVPRAYLVSGSNFPDALSAAPHAALSDGPILLAGNNDRLPAATVAELKRLKPEEVRIIGGGTVGPYAHAQIDSLSAADGSEIISGRDRYETSALLSTRFDYGVSVAYVANGMEFPDALAGGPVAGIRSGSVLLTSRDSLPKTVADELKRLRPDRIVILGGTGAVSAKVEAQLEALSG